MIPELFNALSLGTPPPWLNFILDSLLIVLIALILQLVLRFFANKIHTSVERNDWGHWSRIVILDRLIVKACYTPVSIMIWGLALIHVVEQFIFTLLPNLQIPIFLANSQTVVVLVLIAWSVSRLITLTVTKIEESVQSSRQLKHTVNVLAISLRTFLFVIISLVVLDELLGIRASTVAAYLGGGALILGYAAKETIANFISTVAIFVDNPFGIGDWIYSPDRKIEGTVEYIGWRNTVVRTFDQRPLYVPNSIFASISVENASRMRNRRIKKIVGIRYQDLPVLPAITKDINDYLRARPDLDKRRTTFAALTHYSPSSLDILIYTFTKTKDWVPFQLIQEAVLIDIAEIIKKHGAEIAFPTTTIDLPQTLPELPIVNRSSSPPTQPTTPKKS